MILFSIISIVLTLKIVALPTCSGTGQTRRASVQPSRAAAITVDRQLSVIQNGVFQSSQTGQTYCLEEYVGSSTVALSNCTDLLPLTGWSNFFFPLSFFTVVRVGDFKGVLVFSVQEE